MFLGEGYYALSAGILPNYHESVNLDQKTSKGQAFVVICTGKSEWKPPANNPLIKLGKYLGDFNSQRLFLIHKLLLRVKQ